MIKLKILVLFLITFATGYAQEFNLKNGDLIFQESGGSDLNAAIKDVTSGIDGYNFTHVGIVWVDADSDSVFVIEATHPQVCITPIDKFLNPENKKQKPRSVVGRLKQQYEGIIAQAIEEGKLLKGKAYDDAFDLSNDMYYCSELVYLILKKANNGNDVFELNDMTFKSKDTGEFSDNWVKHFSKLGIPIPEGQKGINPGAMSRSEVIDIVYYYK